MWAYMGMEEDAEVEDEVAAEVEVEVVVVVVVLRPGLLGLRRFVTATHRASSERRVPVVLDCVVGAAR